MFIQIFKNAPHQHKLLTDDCMLAVTQVTLLKTQ